MKPRLSILDKAFRYRNSANTDVHKTWEAARRRERDAKEEPTNVKPLIKAPQWIKTSSRS